MANDLDLDVVLAHEKIHAQQLHTVDILLSELFVCVFWFHPVAWWLRTKLRANLEYLVDANVVRRMNKRTYQLALVRQSQRAYGLALALPFSDPSLKGRIKRLGNLPRHWIVAVVSAVGLLFWLGMTALVMRGTVSPNQSIQFDTSSYHVNLYLKRLPYPNELAAIREVLPAARQFQIDFYQSCLDAPEVYSFAIGKLDAPDRNRSNAKLGGYFDHNFRLEIQATPILGSSSGQTFYGDIDWPTDAPGGEIALQINGNWQKLPAPVLAAYRSDQLDAPPPNEKLVCLLGQHRKNYHDSFLWNMSIKG
ncbi:MAG: M56 family metallopeptidase, partial [Bacteroidota bacterium]